ncbi:MAG: type B DNA-directed DNA polymerase [Halobacteriota archaeon]
MVFAIDFTDEGVRRWERTAAGVESTLDRGYTPTIYATTAGDTDALARRLETRRDVVATDIEQWRTGFREDPAPVLRVDVASIDRVTPVAAWIRTRELPGDTRLFNVDFSRGFRYCVETGTDPTPTRPLRTCRIEAGQLDLADPPIDELRVNDERLSGTPDRILADLEAVLADVDPDVLVLSTADLVPVLFEMAAEVGMDLSLGRATGYRKLAGASTYESYGRVGHSPARYTVPGRAIVDRSNTFLYRETTLDGCLYLVSRSYKPIEEVSWASIGTVLTAIQIREALSRSVLVPWNSWRHELFKPMRTLHDADRGGFTFAPEVGVHEGVHELDFSSLYPNVIVTRNVSPETVRCACHADRADVPGLGYPICETRGYLPDVLETLIADRDAIKAELRDCADPDRREALEGRSSAIKWILVSCFGYQGFSNAKFGRIECHETINAYAREILLDAKATLEANGWRVIHGIVDSLWVQPIDDAAQTPLSAVVEAITAEAGIRLEHEATYEWLSFVPQRDGDRGALTKYFGRNTDGEYKYRGIECRQRSTPEYVATAQRALIDVFDGTRDPAAVCDRLAGFRRELYRGHVDPETLVTSIRVSKDRDAYTQRTRTVAALERAASIGLARSPGQSIAYVVVDDEKSSCDRVRLAVEEPDRYDPTYYDTELLRAATSVVSPCGWTQDRIESYLSSTTSSRLGSFL